MNYVKEKNVKNLPLIFSGLLLYKLLLDYAYKTYISVDFAYVRFNNNFSLYKYLLGLLLFTAMFIAMPKVSNRPSYIVLQIHFVMMFVPLTVVFAFMNLSIYFMILATFVFIAECLIVCNSPYIKIPGIKNSKVLIGVFAGAITIFVYVSMLRANGMPSLASLDFNYIYKIREKIVYPFLTGYLVPWQSKVINPFLIAMAVKKKNVPMIIITVAMQFFLYLMIPEKSFLFIPAVIIFVMTAIEKIDFLPMISLGAPSGIAAILILMKVTGYKEIASTFIRRLLILPAQLKFYWYEFFSENPKIMFSQGSLGRLLGIRNPYPRDAAKIIASWFFNQPEMHSNSGYISDAYGNAGTLGVLFVSLIFVVILLIIDSFSLTMDFGFVIGLMIFHIISLNDGGLITALITGGLIPLLLLMWLYSSDNS